MAQGWWGGQISLRRFHSCENPGLCNSRSNTRFELLWYFSRQNTSLLIFPITIYLAEKNAPGPLRGDKWALEYDQTLCLPYYWPALSNEWFSRSSTTLAALSKCFPPKKTQFCTVFPMILTSFLAGVRSDSHSQHNRSPLPWRHQHGGHQYWSARWEISTAHSKLTFSPSSYAQW